MTTKTSKLCIIIIIVIILTFIAGVITGQKSVNNVINAYDNYNAKCEILLDSIADSDYPFDDTIGETDTYIDYLDAREHLDSVLYTK